MSAFTDLAAYISRIRANRANGVRALDELTTEEQADKIIAELNIYGAGVRERVIAHLEAAEERGFDSYPSYCDD